MALTTQLKNIFFTRGFAGAARSVRVFAANRSAALLMLLFVTLIAGAGITFYYYGYLTVNVQPEVSVEKATIDKQLYQKVFDDITVRSRYEPPSKEYKNPFR